MAGADAPRRRWRYLRHIARTRVEYRRAVIRLLMKGTKPPKAKA